MEFNHYIYVYVDETCLPRHVDQIAWLTVHEHHNRMNTDCEYDNHKNQPCLDIINTTIAVQS
jgi:hypothetical protein